MGGRRVPDVPLDRVFNSPTTPVHAFRAALGNLSYKERKSIVTLCRAQKVPSRQEAKILAYQAFGNHDGVDDLQDTHFRRLCALVRKYIESPLWSGFLLDLARSVEPTKEEYTEICQASWEEEIIACNSERRSPSLNFNTIFSPATHSEESFIPGIPPRQEVYFYLHNLLVT